ncbi:MAG: NAD(P)/FAD-dependent oxidoreductase [Bacteroidales bacterium]|nr:NAD(P)/FAD-dependent oxidoreductase [Bacteroidales bacterium]
MEKFDIAIIGSGPAGFSAAMRGIDLKKHVCLIEKDTLGGAGIYNGALTSKTMWQLSHDYSVAAAIDRGYRASGLQVNFQEVIKSVRSAAKTKVYQMLSQIESIAKGHYNNCSMSLKYGHAKFIDEHTLEIEKNGDKTLIHADKIIIASGSRPRPYPGIEVDHQRIIDSDDVMDLKEFPERIIIVGSGIIGTEFATIFSNFKQTEVHLLDRQHRVIPFEDDDVSDFVSKNLAENGVVIHHTANLRTIRQHDEYLEIVLDYEDGHSKVLEVDVAFMAIGRVPNTDHLGLENIGIKPNKWGYLQMTDNCKLKSENNKLNHIYVAGDISGATQLYSVAEIQGRHAISTIYDEFVKPVSYYNMPTLMFFKPEVAAVGMNEKQLQAAQIPYRSVYYSNELVNRAIAMRNTNGFIKIFISDDGDERIMGMRASGPQASAFIVSVAHMMNEKNSLDEILKTIHPHPSITEGIQECLRVFKGNSIFKPYAFPDLIHTKTWHPEDE